MNFNKDELNCPEWMNLSFLQEVMDFNGNKDIVVSEFKIQPATDTNDHWSSIMYRVEVIYVKNKKSERKSIIVKAMPEVDGVKKELCKSSIFENEIELYSKIIPEFVELQNSCKTKHIFGPQILYYSKSPRYIVVLEDLSEIGYAVPRGRMCKIEELKLCLIKLARWHAISFKIIKKNPNIFQAFSYGLMDHWDWYNNETIRDCYQHFTKAVNNIPGFEKFVDKIKLIRDDLMKKTIDSYKNKIASDFCVLNHGDVHLKNLMFQNDDQQGLVKDVLFVDYQLSVRSTVSIDLYYFLYLSMDSSTRMKYKDELIDFYYDNFMKSLKDIEYNGDYPTRTDFDNELFKHRHLELLYFILSVPFMYVMAFEDFILNVEDCLKNNDVREQFYKNPRYLKDLKEYLPLFSEKNYF